MQLLLDFWTTRYSNNFRQLSFLVLMFPLMASEYIEIAHFGGLNEGVGSGGRTHEVPLLS